MQDPVYRCHKCSTRATVVVVPVDEKAEHTAWHETIEKEGTTE